MSAIGRIYQIVRRNLGYKVVSLFFALLFWLWVSYQGTAVTSSIDQTLTIPVAAKGLPSNLIVMSKMPSVKVLLQDNSDLNIKGLSAYVDLSGAVEGEHDYPVAIEVLSTNIKIAEVQPANVLLTVDVIKEKVLDVAVNIIGSPQSGFVAGNPIVKPAAVNVRGPSSLLNKLEKATAELDISGSATTLQTTCPILFRDQNGQPLYGPDPTADVLLASPNNVEVIVPIQPAGLASKKVALKVSSTGTPAQGMVLLALLPVPESVEIWGPPDALQKIESLTPEPVDITNLKTDKVFQITAAQLSLPQGVTLATGTNLTVVAQIGSALNRKTLSGVAVKVRNVAANLAIYPAIPTVEVSVRGKPEILQALVPDQLQLWVDAAGLTAGNYSNSKVYWQLPPGVEMVTVPQVSMNLKARLQ
ncbi:MAG TPA: CdaR family protein [Desulfitobacteriaceae bacterium]|nr:CdaR family protein [Desulfitobacteriaceae bacterium]